MRADLTNPYDDNDYLLVTCRQCKEDVRLDADEPLADGPYVCDACIRETIQREVTTPERVVYADKVQPCERAILENITDLAQQVQACQTPAEALALSGRISALWLAMDALDLEALRRADDILKGQK